MVLAAIALVLVLPALASSQSVSSSDDSRFLIATPDSLTQVIPDSVAASIREATSVTVYSVRPGGTSVPGVSDLISYWPPIAGGRRLDPSVLEILRAYLLEPQSYSLEPYDCETFFRSRYDLVGPRGTIQVLLGPMCAQAVIGTGLFARHTYMDNLKLMEVFVKLHPEDEPIVREYERMRKFRESQ